MYNSTIVFIDTQVANYQQLADAVTSDAEVILIDANQDGIDVIANVLAARQNLKSIQIISHGSAGNLQLGSTWLNSGTLQDYSVKIRTWGEALTDDGDILLLGCNLAADEDGLNLIRQISELTGADVAASGDITGSSALGGDWDLEANVGAIEAPIAIEFLTLNTYDSVFATGEGLRKSTGGITPNIDQSGLVNTTFTGLLITEGLINQTHKFQVDVDDDAQLTLDTNLLINDRDGSAGRRESSNFLISNNFYPITVGYQNAGGASQIILQWKPSTDNNYVTIPERRFFPGTAAQIPTISITPVQSSVSEGDTVRFRITADKIPNFTSIGGSIGTTVYYTISGANGLTANDFSPQPRLSLEQSILITQSDTEIPLPLVSDNVYERNEQVTITLGQGAYLRGANQSATVNILDNEPLVSIQKLADKTEGEKNSDGTRLAVKDVARINFAFEDGSQTQTARDFNLSLDILGTAVRGSFANTQRGSDYKLFYTSYRTVDNAPSPIGSRAQLPDPVARQSNYSINVPVGTEYILLQAEDINDELLESPETIIVQLIGKPEYATNPQQNSVTVNLLDNEPTVSLGRVINPVEGFSGFGTTIASLEDAITFNGTTQYVAVRSNDSLNLQNIGKFTQEAWIFPQITADGTYGIIGYNAGNDNAYPSISLVKNSSGTIFRIGFGGRTVDASASANFNANGWNHVATTFDGTDYKLYVNAVEVFSTRDFAGQTPAPTQQLEIGKTGSNYFKGAIDEVRLWNVARSAGEIQQNYIDQIQGDKEGLVGYWDFNKNFADKSGNGNDGLYLQPSKAINMQGGSLFGNLPTGNLRWGDDYTLESWVKVNSSSPNQIDIFNIRTEGFTTETLSLNRSNRSIFILQETGQVSRTQRFITLNTETTFTNNWHHFAVTYDGQTGSRTVYFDGNKLGDEILKNNPFNLPTEPNYNSFAIGNQYYNSSNSANIAANEIRIWKKKLTDGEIKSNFQRSLSGNTEGLVTYINTDNNITTIRDSSPNNIPITSSSSRIEDSNLLLSPFNVSFINNPAPQIGYVEVNLDRPVEAPQGLWVKYDITGGSAGNGTDYFSSRYRKVSTDSKSERNGIIIPKGESSGRIYFSAISDTLVEGDEEVTIRLIPHNFDDENNGSNYAIGSSATTTITIKDNQAYQPGVVLLDEKKQVISDRNKLGVRTGSTTFNVKLSSQPIEPVNISLSVSSGRVDLVSAPLTFNSTNWNTPIPIRLSGVSADGVITATSTTSSYSFPSETFSFTTNPDLRVTEGSATDAIPVIPQVSIVSQGDVTEDSGLSGNFVVNLSAPAPKGGIDVNYSITGNATPSVDYQAIGNYALNFDGIDDYVRFDNISSLPKDGSYTLEAWIKPDQMGTRGIIGWGTYGTTDKVNALRLTNNGIVNYWWGSDFEVTNTEISAKISNFSFVNQWHQVAVSYDSTVGTTGKVTIFIDGINIKEFTPARRHSVTKTDNLTIGSTNGSEYFDGLIRDVRIWNTARTQEQINNNKNTLLNGDETGLVANYQGQKANNNSLTDSSGNNNQGELKNGTSYVQLNTGTITIPEGETKGIIPVLPIADRLTEANETVAVTLNDGSGYTRDITKSLATLYITDDDPAGIQVVNANITGRYINFDGVDDSVSVSNSGLTTGNTIHTLEAWVYLDQLPTNRAWLALLGQNGSGSHHWLIGSDGRLQIGVYGGNQIANSPSIQVGQWTHLATVFDGTNLTLYINGVKFGNSVPAAFNFTNTELGLGKILETPFKGKIRDVRVWNAARTETQIKDNKDSILKGNETGLVAYYQGNASNNSLINSATATGSAANGTLNRGATTQDIYGYSNSLVDIITNEPYPTVGNTVELRNSQGVLLGSITLTQDLINTGKVTITPNTAVTADDVISLKANLKENAALNTGLNINNEQLKRLDNGNIEIELPTISNSALFAIRLQTKPSADVTINFSGLVSTEGSLDKNTVTFTPQNWDTYQIVTVTGVDDTNIDGDISYQITANVATTTDTAYQGKTFIIPVQNLDDDEKIDVIKNVSNTSPSNFPTVTIGNPITVSEGTNQTATVTINLSAAQPQSLSVLFDISGGTATLNKDYRLPQGSLIYSRPVGIKLLPSPFDNVDVGTNSSITFVDLDKDGDLDAVLGSNNGLKYYQNIGETTAPIFQEQTGTNNPFSNITSPSFRPTFGDINGDGTLDLIVGKNDGSLSYYLNKSTPNNLRFQLPTTLNPVPNNPISGINLGAGVKAQPLLVDWNNDGKLDLIIGYDSGVSYYENTGTKTNAIFTQRSGASNPFNRFNGSPFLSDWDKDGDLDLFAGEANGVINYYQNDNGSFSLYSAANYPFPNNAVNLGRQATPTLADLDGDGDLDAFVGNANGTIDYYEQFNVVTFAPGETTKSVNITINEDQIAEGNEDIKVSLYQNTGYSASYIGFDGVDDSVSVSNSGLTTGNTIHTLEAWVYLDQLPTYQAWLALLGQNASGSEQWLINSNGKLQVGVYGGAQIAGSPTLEVGQWTHLATVFDGTGLTLYINGVKSGKSVRANFNFTNTEFSLGKLIETPFKGKIRDVRIWDIARTPDQIQGNKDVLLKGDETGLVANYQGNAANTFLINSATATGSATNGILIGGATSNAVSQNSNYQLLNGAGSTSDITTTINISDNDTAGITITKIIGTNTSETGDTVSYNVRLNSQPTAPVTVYLGSKDETEGLVATGSSSSDYKNLVALEFNPNNWNQNQTFSVRGVDDRVDDGDISYQVIPTLSSEDLKYNKLPVNPITLSNTDNDIVGFTVRGAGRAVEGRENIYDIKLNSQPVGKIRVIMTPANDQIRLNNEFIGQPLTLTFNPDNWNLEQTIRVTALDDSLVEYLHSSEIKFKVETGTGLNFESKTDNNTSANALDLGEIKGGYTGKNLAIKPVFREGSTPDNKVLVSNDIDWYKFTIPDTGNFQDFVEIQFDHNKGDLKLELYRGSNLTTPISTSDTSSTSNNKERIELNGQPAGEYYLKVSGINDDIANQYELLIADEDYKFTPITPQPLNVIIEDNDLPTARIIAGPTASEVFGQPSYFAIQLNAPAPLGDNGINVNYRVSGGTATFDEDTNANGILDSGEDKNGNNQLDIGDYRIQREGSVRIAPGDIQNNLIVVPIDDKLVEDINLTVTSSPTNGSGRANVGKKVLSIPISIPREGQSNLTIASGTEINFNDNVVAKVKDSATLTLNSVNQTLQGNINVEVDSDVLIAQNYKGKISSETVIVELLPGDGYQLSPNPQATLEIQDDDVPGVRIVQVGDNTVVREGETATFEISLLSESRLPVTITLTPGSEIEFVNPNGATVLVDKDVYEFDTANATGTNSQYFNEFVDIKLNSLVTTDQGKTISFDVQLRSQPSCLHIGFDDGVSNNNNGPSRIIEFSASEGTWDQVRQVVLTNLDRDTNGDFKIKATIDGNDIIIPISHSIEQVQKKTTTITIQPQDWYKLQTVTIKGSEDGVSEPGLYHQSNIKYTVTSGDSSYNGVFVPSQRIDVLDRVLNPEDTADAIQEGLTLLQQSLENLKIPLIGSLKGKFPPLISDITNRLAAAISSTSDLTGAKLSKLMNDTLNSIGLDFLNVTVATSLESIAILLEVKKEYKLFNLSLDKDLGLDALGIGLKTEGQLKSNFNLDAALGFGIHKDFGFYIDTDQTKVEAKVKLNLEDFKGQGNLGFLRLDFQDDVDNKDANGNLTPDKDNPTELAISFKAGINDLDNYQNVQFLDVDGDGLLDVNAFNYGIKKDTDRNGKADIKADGTFDTQIQSIKEPLTNIAKNGQAEDFPKVSAVSDEAKRINWNNYGESNNTFTEDGTIANEGIYRTVKNSQGQVIRYYFDRNRNGQQDSRLENLFSVQATSDKWVKDGKVKEFRIAKKKVNGKIQYFFDKDGNSQIDVGEAITEKEKKKIDKNNNLKLDADVTIEGEGRFVQGAGIAFKDLNKNGKLDSTEYSTVVNSNFGDLTISDDAISSIEYWDVNNNNQLDESDDFRVRTNDDEIRYLDLNRNSSDRDNRNDDENEPQSASEDEPFVLSNENITTLGRTIRNDSSNLSNPNGRYLDWNSDNKFDIGELYSCDPEEPFAVNLSSGVEFIDFNKNNAPDSGEKVLTTRTNSADKSLYLDLNGNNAKDVGEPNSNLSDGSRFLDLNGNNTKDAGEPWSESEDEPLSLEKIGLTTSTTTIAGTTYNVIIKDRVQFVDLDGNGKLTLDRDGNPLEPTAEPNNDFGKENPNDLLPIRYNPAYTKFLDDGDRLTLTELRNFKNDPNLGFADLFNYQFAGNANLGLIAVTSVQGDPAFPSISFDLAVGLPLFNYGNQDEAGDEKFSVAFNNITLDLGTFLTKFVNPIIKSVDDIISPIKPVLTILNTDTKIFSYLGLEDEFNRDSIKGVSILDIARYIAELIPANTTDRNLKRIRESIPKVVRFVGAVQQIVDTIDSLKALTAGDGSLSIELGSYSLDDLKAASDDPADASSKVNAGQQGTKTPAQNANSPLNQASNAGSPAQKSAFSKLKSLEGLSIPLLSDPSTLVRILLGEPNVDLITYDIPDLDLYFQRDFEFPIISIPPVIKGRLGLGFEAKTDLAVGYDTHGLEAWRDSGFDLEEVYKVLDGFYLNDWKPDGTEKDELSASASIIAGLSASLIVIKAVLRGGITGSLGFDIVDVGELQGKSDGKIRGSEITSRIKTPLQLFNLKGQLDAFASGAIKVGIDAGVFEIMQTVWGINIGPITLAKFNVGASGIGITTPVGSVSGSYVNGATVFFDANFNGIWDVGDDNNPTEPIAFSNEYGQYDLPIGLEWDRNGDGAIDYLDGQIISVGGFDTSSGTPAGRFIGLPGSSIITPLTSIQAPLVLEYGLTPDAAEELIKAQLGIDPNFNIESFDSLNAVGQSIKQGLDPDLVDPDLVDPDLVDPDLVDPDLVDPNLVDPNSSSPSNVAHQNNNLGLDIYLDHIKVQALFNQARSFVDGLQGESADLNNMQLVQSAFAKFLLERSRTNNQPIDLNSQEAIASFYTFLVSDRKLIATTEQLDIASQFLIRGNKVLAKVAEIGTSKSLQETLPALASVKRVIQADIPVIIKDFFANKISKEKALANFEETINQNYTLVSDDINSFGNRSVKVTSSNVNISEDSTESPYFTIELSHPAPNQGLTVVYSVSGTSTLNEDYTFVNNKVGEVYIAPGETKGFVKLSLIDDAIAESIETITIRLTEAGEGYLINPNASVGFLSIIDNEESNPNLNTTGNDIEGTFGEDNLEGSEGNDLIQGLYGKDTINGRGGDDFIQGGHSSDIIFGGVGGDHLEGNFGDDTIEGNEGNDFLDGGSGDDKLYGGSGFDIIFGGTGNDILEGNSGNDQLEGGDGSDRLYGNENNDWLLGDDGNDLLVGGQGDDIISGGRGKDVFFFSSSNEGFDTILDFNPDEGDVIQISRSGFGVDNLDGFRFISGILDFQGKNLALIQNNGQTYSYFPDLSKIIKIVDEPTISANAVKPSSQSVANSTSQSPTQITANIEPDATTILDDIVNRGYLKVASYFDIFDRAFTRTLATALFGDPSKIEYVEYETYADSFKLIADGDVDLNIDRISHNFDRDTESKIDFTPLFLYDSQVIMVRKERNVDNIFDLNGMTIGVIRDSTGYINLKNTFDSLPPDANGKTITFTPKFYADVDLVQSYLNGEIDAFSVDKTLAIEFIKKFQESPEQYSFKYDPSLENQTLIDVEFSKEPISAVIRENDSTWADFVRWVNYIPVQAEEFGINSQNVEQIYADNIDENIFNDSSPAIRRFLGIQDNIYQGFLKYNIKPDFVVKIIKEVGNYGEIFSRYFPDLERDRNDLWSNGGLLYSPPFAGNPADITLIDNSDRNVLTDVLKRGKLVVGTGNTNAGFAIPDENGKLVGFDIDLSKALAAAIFGDSEAVEFVEQTSLERFTNVANGIVDITIDQATNNLVRDTQFGVDFVATYLYTGQGVLTRKDSGIFNIATLNGRKIGAVVDTTSIQNLKDALVKYGAAAEFILFDDEVQMFAAYERGEVEAVTNDTPLLGSAIRTLKDPEKHYLLNANISKEPLAMVIDENQSDWGDVVQWVYNSLLQAEEYGITQANINQILADNSDDNPDNNSEAAIRILLGFEGSIGRKLGIPNDFVARAIKAVGNYGEIYQRHFNSIPRGFNELSTDFGLQIPYPSGIITSSIEPPISLSIFNNDVFAIGGTGNVKLKVLLSSSNSNSVNEVGAFTVDDELGTIGGLTPESSGYNAAALARSKVIFSTIVNKPAGFNVDGLPSLVELAPNTNLRFYVVKNGTTGEALKANNFSNVIFSSKSTLKIANLGKDSFSLGWEDGSGSNDFNDLVINISTSIDTSVLGARQQNNSQGNAIIDLRFASGLDASKTSVTADFVVNREAAYNNFVGFYKIADLNGGIDTNGDGVADLMPNQSGYIKAAIQGRVAGIDLTVPDQGTSSITGTFNANSIFAPFIIVNSNPTTLLDAEINNDPAVYFSFLGANSDGVAHIRMLGTNTFGFEDLPSGGDRDFNDLIVRVKLS